MSEPDRGARAMEPMGRIGVDETFERHLVHRPGETGLARLGVLYRLRALTAGGALHRFLQAARHAAAVHHDHLERVIEVEASAGPVLVAQVAPSESLSALLEAGPCPAPVAVALVAQAASGLAALHARGLVHGAVDPSWIFVDYQGRVRLCGAAALSAAGAIGLSPEPTRYLPLGEEPTAARDVWALAAVLHATLTGQTPAVGGGVGSGVPSALVGPLARFLGPARERPVNGGELAAALNGVLASAGGMDTAGVATWLRERNPRRFDAWKRVLHALRQAEPDVRVARLAGLLLAGRPLPEVRDAAPEARDAAPEPSQRAVPERAPPALISSDDFEEVDEEEDTDERHPAPVDAALNAEAPSAPPASAPPPPPEAARPSLPADPKPEVAPAPPAPKAPELRKAPPPPRSAPHPPSRRGEPAMRAADPTGARGVPADGFEPDLWEEDEELAPREVPELQEVFNESRSVATGDPNAPPVLEVLRMAGSAVGSTMLRVGDRYPRRAPWVRLVRAGGRLRVPPGATGTRTHLGVEEPLPAGPAEVQLDLGDRARLVQGGTTWLLRVDHGAREAGRVAGSRRPWAMYLACVGVALGLHLVLMGGVMSLNAMGVRMTVQDQVDAERFVSLETLNTPPEALPKPPPPPPPKPKPAPKPVAPSETAQVAPRPVAADPADARPALPAAARRRLEANRKAARNDVEALEHALDPGGREDKDTLEAVRRGLDALPNRGGGHNPAFEVANVGVGPADAPINVGGGGGGGTGRVETRGEEVVRNGAGRLKDQGREGRIRGTVQNVRALTKVACDMDRDAVRRVVEGATGRITGCYEQALLKRSDLSGKLTIEWELDARGHPNDVKVRLSTVGEPAVGACVLDVIRKLSFPSPPGGQSCVISYPFIFSTNR